MHSMHVLEMPVYSLNTGALIITITLLHLMLAQMSLAARSPGGTYPSRVEIEIGGSANISCVMNLQMFAGNNSSSLYFIEKDTEMEVPKKDLTILNTTTIVYAIKNARPQNKSYICMSGTNAIAETKVSVGTAPAIVNDFGCRGYYYMYMVCNFTLPQNTVLTTYNLTYASLSPDYLQTCDLEIQDDMQVVCNLTLDKNNYRLNYEVYYFTLMGFNSLGVKKQNFQINHYESVIPPRPDIHIDEVTDDSAVLTWQLAMYSYYEGLEYEIKLRAAGFDWMHHPYYDVSCKESEYRVKLQKLPYAFYWYTVSVRIRGKSTRSAVTMWSEKFKRKFQTKERLPKGPPVFDVGSFYIDSTETQLTLYWQELPSFYDNGPDFQYVIKNVRRDGEEMDLQPLHINRISVIYPWTRNHQYEFLIKSKNAVGESLDGHTVIVPAMKENHAAKLPQWIRNIYHASNLTYTLSWSPPADPEDLVDYTVFWCQPKRATLNECRGSMKFIHLNKNTTKYSTEPQEQEVTLNFAVSANYKNYSSGMRWSMCTADVTSDLVKLEPEVTQISARSIKVQWSPDRVCTSLLEGYYLTFCLMAKDRSPPSNSTKCRDTNTSLTIENTAKNVLITDLQPFSTYMVEIYMFSKLKKGKPSDPIVARTEEEAPTPPRNLKLRNITSDSAWISWMPPTQMNGKLRYYIVMLNNEKYIINCTTQMKNWCSDETEKELSFKLENLRSFTNYKGFIIANTIAASFPSNDIHFKTLIGFPSNPRHMKSNNSLMYWSTPITPSGRVEFYEVAVIVRYKGRVQRERISGIVGATSCTINIPECLDNDYEHDFQVRAVNTADRSTEVVHQDLLINNNTEQNREKMHYYAMYDDDDDLKCIGTAMTDAEQAKIIAHYRNATKYEQFKSVWEKGPTYRCTVTTKLSKVIIIVLFAIVLSVSSLAAFYLACKKYNKMTNIECSLPPGLGNNISQNSARDSDEIDHSKEALYSNEKHHLLSSVCNDSCYLGGLFRVNGLAPCSIGKSSGYVGSEGSDDGGQKIEASTKLQEPVMDAYVAMELLKTDDAESNGVKSQIVNGAADTGYVKIIRDDSFPNVKTESPIITCSNGYIKPSKAFSWQTADADPMWQCSSSTGRLAVTDSDYVQPELLHKKAGQPPSIEGYTTLEALGQSTLQAIVQNAPESGLCVSSPPISGYVTQKELSAFGQQKLS